MKKIFTIFLVIALLAGGTLAARDFLLKKDAEHKEKIAVAAVPAAPLGIGAIGRIEPRSRVIRLSHDQGPEGARVEKILVEEGQTVQAGDVLVIFSDAGRRQSELETVEARLKAMEARLPGFQAEKTNAEIEFQRSKKLIDSAAVSRAAHDQARARYQKAAADLNTATFDVEIARNEAQLSLKKLEQSTLKAPMDGTILKIHARPGERVGDSAIMEFADLTQLDVVAEVYENDIARIKVGQGATVTLPGSAAPYAATVRENGFIVRKNDLNDTDPLADRDNRVVEVRLTLDEASVNDLRHQILRQVHVHILP